MIKVKLLPSQNIKVRLKPDQGIKVGLKTTYLFDNTLIDDEVALAKDWAIKSDGMVVEEGEDVDYSSKAWAIGGEGTETNNSKYYAEQAAISETNAGTSETNAAASALAASQDAGVASTKASDAATSESNALSYSQSAASSANDASHSAADAYSSETSAASSASTATTQAGIATTKASEAAASALQAANSAIWAEGTDIQVEAIGGEHSSKGWAGVAKALVDSIGSVLHYKGSVATKDDLPTSGQELGDMYNVIADGSNWVWDGTDWDEISGIVDLSAYRTAADQDVIDAGKQPIGNYVTTDTEQDITVTKTFKAPQKFQSGDGGGCMIIGADVSATTVTNGARKTGRMCFYTNEDITLKCCFVSTDCQNVGGGAINSVEFGGRTGDKLNTAPDSMTFTVANSHNSTTSKQVVAEYTSSGSTFNNTNLAPLIVNRTSSTGGSFVKYTRNGTSLGYLGIAGVGLPTFSDDTATNSDVLVRGGTLSSPAVGSATQPVYIDSNGVAQATANQIPTTAAQVNALPDTTKYGADLDYTNSTLQLLDKDGNALGNPVTISGGGSSSTLSGLTDVTLTSPTNGQALLYDGSKWVNGSAGVSATYDSVNERITFA